MKPATSARRDNRKNAAGLRPAVPFHFSIFLMIILYPFGIQMHMKAVCTLRLEFPDENTARSIAGAMQLDNAGYVETRIEGNVLYATTTADNVMALRNTVDDFLACANVAQKSLEGSK